MAKEKERYTNLHYHSPLRIISSQMWFDLLPELVWEPRALTQVNIASLCRKFSVIEPVYTKLSFA